MLGFAISRYRKNYDVYVTVIGDGYAMLHIARPPIKKSAALMGSGSMRFESNQFGADGRRTNLPRSFRPKRFGPNAQAQMFRPESST